MNLPPLPTPDWLERKGFLFEIDSDSISNRNATELVEMEKVKAYGQACREAALLDAAALCNGEQWMMSGKKSVDYITAFNEGCTDCEAVIRRLK